MDDKLIFEINEKTQIVDLVSEFVSLSKKGKNFMGLCPFHNEKTPSFSVSPEKNIAKCMSCGEGGTPINFYRKIKNISFEEAATELASRLGIMVSAKKVETNRYQTYYDIMKEASSFYQFNLKNSQQGQQALVYLTHRQLKEKDIDHFNIGYAPSFGNSLYQLLKDKGYATSDLLTLGLIKQKDDGSYYDLFIERIIFPITNPKGNIVGFSGRTIQKDDPVKYINSPESVIFKKGQLLYHYYESIQDIRKSKQVVLMEGFFDVISATISGTPQSVATMGTALTKDQAQLIKNVSDSVIIAYDGDAAGLKASNQAIEVLRRVGLKVEVLMIPEKMDPDDFIKSYGPEAFDALFGEYTKDGYQFRYDYFKIGKDLKNANDISEFKNNVETMIKYADLSIQAVYRQKLANDLGIPIESIKKPVNRQIEKSIILPKIERIKITNKHEKAERYLIFEMMKSKKVAQKVASSLSPNDFTNHIQTMIRICVEKFYEDHQTFDLSTFLDTLTSEHRTFVEKELLNDMHYKNNLSLTEKEIENHIAIVKDAGIKRRAKYLMEKINELETNTESYQKELTGILKYLNFKK